MTVGLVDFGAATLFIGLIMYATFGGADFGGGIWTALASGPRKAEQRKSLFQAIGPVWETNHVWLIYIVVVLLMAFPKAFSALFTALLMPLVIALVGINFRGAAFAFRHFGGETGREVPLLARTFEASSMLTPFVFGMAVAATAQDRIEMVDDIAVAGSFDWVTPFTIGGGLIGLAICAYLAPIYMTVRTVGGLREDFRKRGMAAGAILGLLTTLQIPVAMIDAPLFAEKLGLTRVLICIGLAVAGGLGTEILLWKNRFRAAQILSAFTVTFTLLGFAAALWPDMLLGRMSIAAAAAPRETLVAFFTVLPFGVIIIAPSLFFLYWTFRGSPDPGSPPENFRV